MLDRNRHTEAGYIGEEFFAERDKDRLHKCLVVEQAISEGYFSFDDALAAYVMDREEYEQYIAKKSSDVIFSSISGTTVSIETKVSQPVYFEVFAKMVGNSSKTNDIDIKVERKLKRIEQQLLGISKEMGEVRIGNKKKA